jgi:hypothetical protein
LAHAIAFRVITPSAIKAIASFAKIFMLLIGAVGSLELLYVNNLDDAD